MLAGGAALALLGASACGSAPPPKIDDLVAQLELAHRDSALAAAAAAVASRAIAPALTTVASERAQHAQSLAAEIARVAGQPDPITTETPTSTSAPAGPPPSVADVIGALRTSADRAGQLATTSSGYRAGLLGSIAAACTASYTVALVAPETAP